SLSQPINVASIVSVPESIVTSNYFGYSGGYAVASTLTPGEGYWVKTSAPGILQLSTTLPLPAGALLRQHTPRLNTLTVGDGAGHAQTLYFGPDDGSVSPDRYELPPRPPANVFDVRF